MWVSRIVQRLSGTTESISPELCCDIESYTEKAKKKLVMNQSYSCSHVRHSRPHVIHGWVCAESPTVDREIKLQERLAVQ